MDQEINEVYLKTDSLFKLKLKSQIKGSGLIFERLFHLEDLINDDSYFYLIINKQSIYFNNIIELYSGLIKIIDTESSEIEESIKSLMHHKRKDLNCDKTSIDGQIDELSNREYKLGKLKDQIEKTFLLPTANQGRF